MMNREKTECFPNKCLCNFHHLSSLLKTSYGVRIMLSLNGRPGGTSLSKVEQRSSSAFVFLLSLKAFLLLFPLPVSMGVSWYQGTLPVIVMPLWCRCVRFSFSTFYFMQCSEVNLGFLWRGYLKNEILFQICIHISLR